MRIIAALITIILASHAGAADYAFNSLYEKDGFVTERLLPFSITSTLSGPFTVESVTVAKPCHAMIDLHRANIVLLYCTEATQTSFSIKIVKDGSKFELSSPTFEVKKVALISSTPEPTPDGWSKGKIKFVNNCAKCHQAPYPIAKGVTKTTLTNAFAGKPMRNGKTTPAMSAYKDFFSDAELNLLVKFINEEL